jgi:hypothetical protein
MSSSALGKPISGFEVTNLGPPGIWLLLDTGEHFLPYELYPWFKRATIEQILDVKLLHAHHLYWPQLDVDLSTEIISRPEDFPLLSGDGVKGGA